MTHIQNQRELYTSNRAKIQRLLKWTELQYAQYQERIGYQYMQHQLQLDAHAVKQMSYEAMYWRWWVNTWNIIDDQLLLDYLILHPNPEALYCEAHKVQYIATSPMAVHFENTYAKMIGEMNDSINHYKTT